MAIRGKGSQPLSWHFIICVTGSELIFIFQTRILAAVSQSLNVPDSHGILMSFLFYFLDLKICNARIHPLNVLRMNALNNRLIYSLLE